MTPERPSRSHLVERAVEAMGGMLPAATPAQPAPATTRVGSASVQHDRAAPDDLAAMSGRDAVGPADPIAAPVAPITIATLVKAGLAVGPAGMTRSRMAEEISVIQHQVLRGVKSTRVADGRCGRIIMVTSARPAEGKTFISLNLAASIASSGARPVVLVDADGKPLSVSTLVGHQDAPGLRVLAADPSRSAVPLLLPTEIKGLSLLTYGQILPGTPVIPSGAMMTSALLRLAAALPGHLIILDTPPCLSTSDSGALAPLCGQVIMVVHAERTQRNEVEAALDMVEACPALHLLLNRALLTENDSFGAYGYGGYPTYTPAPGGG